MKSILVLAVAAAASSTYAQWTVTNLHPGGASYSFSVGGSSGKQVGYSGIGGMQHASLWSGSAGS
ncbi:MAG: hypothetical protein QW652_07810, partial [Candidatus Nitrosotenuis sp.]